MACGVPVVGEPGQGYEDLLEHGGGGFLYETTAESLTQLESLHSSAELWEEQSTLAQQAVKEALSLEKTREALEFYMR